MRQLDDKSDQYFGRERSIRKGGFKRLGNKNISELKMMKRKIIFSSGIL